MDANNSIAGIVGITDILMPITLFTVWLALRRAQPDAAALLLFGLALAVALDWGGLWVWWPPLAILRTLPPPAGQPVAILSVVVGMVALLALPSVRRFMRGAELGWLATMGVWRVVYGSALLVIGLMQGLPPAFFWSAAFGDIAVGVWGIAIMVRRPDVSARELAGWNGMGLLDLAHVLAVGSMTLRPFYLANPDVTPLNLLPLVGVPVFVALHVMTLWGLAARRASTRHGVSQPSLS